MANEHSQIVPSMQPTSTVADFKFWCQKVLPLVYDDSISYYEVLGKMVVYLNQVIDNINADTANVAELEDDFLLLQTYVNNFFDDIDQLVTYTERAEAAETAAAASAISAASSASNSATSASNSAGSASSAATSALSALDAKDAAVAAKTAAETALASAQTAATNAASSATAASGSATNAAASATAAQQSFTLADAARTSAQSAASSAESDAENAADSAAEAVAAVDTIINGLGNITKTIENVHVATTEDALASIAKKLVVDIEPVQSGSGDPSPDNVRPITGWTGANVSVANKNIIYPKYSGRTNNGITFTINADNTITANGTATGIAFATPSLTDTTLMVFVKAGEYCFSGGKSNTKQVNIGGKYVDGTNIPAIYDGGSGRTLTLTQDAFVYPQIVISAGETCTNEVFKIQLELGTTPTEFEAHQGDTYIITFPSEAGTVYGGTLDVTSGELKITRITHKLTGQRDSVVDIYDIDSVTQSLRFRVFSAYSHPVGSNFADFLPSLGQMCNKLNPSYSYGGFASINYSFCAQGNWGISFGIHIDGFTTLSDYTDWLGTNTPVCSWLLANPITYTLTPEEVITLLNGINNIWADTGNINALEYFTNAENYVTTQLDLAKALIAPVLKEMKADTALVANDFRIVGNTLYRITGNIASGGTLTPGTNCAATTVSEILKTLLT